MPLSPIADERFDWKPWKIGRTPRGDTLVYDILSSLPGLLQSGEWTNIKLASTLTVINVFGNYSAVSADLIDTITLRVCCVGLFFYVCATQNCELVRTVLVRTVPVWAIWRRNTCGSKLWPSLFSFCFFLIEKHANQNGQTDRNCWDVRNFTVKWWMFILFLL